MNVHLPPKIHQFSAVCLCKCHTNNLKIKNIIHIFLLLDNLLTFFGNNAHGTPFWFWYHTILNVLQFLYPFMRCRGRAFSETLEMIKRWEKLIELLDFLCCTKTFSFHYNIYFLHRKRLFVAKMMYSLIRKIHNCNYCSNFLVKRNLHLSWREGTLALLIIYANFRKHS